MTARKMNPPIKGHELIQEGRNWFHPGVNRPVGGCRCGAQPSGCGTLGVNEMKAWHREHKAALRAEAGAS